MSVSQKAAKIFRSSVARSFRCGVAFSGDYIKQFSAESQGERIFKIDQHLADLQARVYVVARFLTHSVQ